MKYKVFSGPIDKEGGSPDFYIYILDINNTNTNILQFYDKKILEKDK